LVEPYSIFTYRYFVQDWPDLTWLAIDNGKIIGSVVCEIKERKRKLRGYIAMLSVEPEYRRRGIAQDLVMQALLVMQEAGCFMAMLETEVINVKATSLYTKLGFQKDKVRNRTRLFFCSITKKKKLLLRYYLNGGDAWRLKLLFGTPAQKINA
jgi:peptide alpha-N-acetyltransferase